MPVSLLNYFFSGFFWFYLFFSSCLAAFCAFLLSFGFCSGGFFTLSDIIFRIIMQGIDELESKLQEISEMMSKGFVNKSELHLKQLEKKVRCYLEKDEGIKNDKLRQIHIAVYNNLACIYEKKGKYKSSLYHLELAQKLEGEYLNDKYNGQEMPSQVLQKLSTTYSNLSAIQSKVGDLKEALKNIQFAIGLINKSKDLNAKRVFIFMFYNYAVLLERTFKYTEASKYALQGLEYAKKSHESLMTQKYEQLVSSLKNHLARQHFRREKIIRKYSKGQVGVFKNVEEYFLGNESEEDKEKEKEKQKVQIKKYWTNTFSRINKTQTKGNQNNKTFQKFYLYKTSLPKRNNRKTSSLNVLDHSNNGKIKPNTSESITTSHNNFQSNRTKINMGIVQAYGLNGERKQKAYSLYANNVIDVRIKERRKKIQKEIENLGEKNEALEKVLEKMCQTGQHEKK